MERIKFMKRGAFALMAISLFGSYSCKEKKADKAEKAEAIEVVETTEVEDSFFKLSLAQWSMHNMIFNDGVDPYSFAEKAKSWGFEGLEYVSGLYYNELKKSDFSHEAMENFVKKSNAEAEKHGLKNVLIMVDGQGDLALSNPDERKKAVENHYKWVNAAADMNCHSIRVNLNGSSNPDEWKKNAADGLKQLATYAKDKNINIVVENHGGLSSNGALLAEVMTMVNMSNCGTLPDFGNFCIVRNDPKDYAKGCAESYDNYKGVEELMPHAKAVSAKSYDFDADGKETTIDYKKMLQIVKNAGYNGYIGVEYEGRKLGEEEGILATKNLLLTASKNLE